MADPTNTNDRELLVEMTSGIVSAYVGNHVVPSNELPGLISQVFDALSKTGTVASAEIVVEKQKPAVSVRRSVQDNQITCLECGGSFKSLKRHLMTNHDLTPDQYRTKWELAVDYPMVAPSYAEARSRLAREMGLGKSAGRRKKAATR